MIALVILLGSSASVIIALAAAFLIVWLGRTAPRRIRRAWRALASLMTVTAGLYAYLSLHLFIEHHRIAHDDADILAPIVGVAGSCCMLAMVFLSRDSLGDPLKVADLRKAAFSDVLTGLPNRRSYDMAVVERLEIARRRDQPLALMLLDIDHFKAVNDRHGHEWGDEVLRQIGRTLRRSKRESDFAFRLGGEEFTVIAPMTNMSQAIAAADRLRQLVETTWVEKDGARIPVTVSIGVAALRADDDATSLFHRADTALYHAKRMGRNNVCVEAAPVLQLTAGAQG